MFDTVRLIAGGLLALICAYLGLTVKNRYKTREAFYTDITSFCAMLRSDIGYEKKTIPNAVKDFCGGRKGECKDTLSAYVSEMKNKSAFVRDVKVWEIAHLSVEEKKGVLSFLQGLGKTSAPEQLSFVAKAESEFAVKANVCRTETKKLGGMYFKLLVLLGLAILVLVA